MRTQSSQQRCLHLTSITSRRGRMMRIKMTSMISNSRLNSRRTLCFQKGTDKCEWSPLPKGNYPQCNTFRRSNKSIRLEGKAPKKQSRRWNLSSQGKKIDQRIKDCACCLRGPTISSSSMASKLIRKSPRILLIRSTATPTIPSKTKPRISRTSKEESMMP